MLVMLLPSSVFAEQLDYVLEEGRPVPIPKTYEVKQVIFDLGEKGGFLNQPEDLFIDKRGFLYVADTGNNRIVKLTTEGKTIDSFTGPADKPLKNPSGIYVDEEGDMYVADTGNSRILHLSPQGKFVEQFVKPESELLGKDFTFTPNRVFVSPTGYIYAIKSQSFLSMDANNKFRGFVGATEVGFDFNRMLVRMFASREQKNRIAKKLPASYSNFVVDDDGMIYATTINAQKGQIRKINSVGKNIYKDQFFGEMVFVNEKAELPYFADIAVDKGGIISVLEQKSGKIYQYDQDANLLTVFGGKGKWKGAFDLPVSLVVDQAGKIYVLDKKLNNIQVFEPTRFIQLVSKAVSLYNAGDYRGSISLWKDVLKIHANYSLAHRGMGKVLLKEGDWKGSMEEYRLVDDKDGYSTAFKEYRHEMIRTHFAWVLLIAILLIAILGWIFVRLKVIANKAWQEGI